MRYSVDREAGIDAQPLSLSRSGGELGKSRAVR